MEGEHDGGFGRSMLVCSIDDRRIGWVREKV